MNKAYDKGNINLYLLIIAQHIQECPHSSILPLITKSKNGLRTDATLILPNLSSCS